MINWKVRIKNKWFWMTIIPAFLVLIQAIAAVFGYTLDFSDLNTKLLAVTEAVFVLLGILGIVVDPTTEGIQDSKLAMTYDEPKPYGSDVEPVITVTQEQKDEPYFKLEDFPPYGRHLK